jgi:hypothetical protein
MHAAAPMWPASAPAGVKNESGVLVGNALALSSPESASPSRSGGGPEEASSGLPATVLAEWAELFMIATLPDTSGEVKNDLNTSNILTRA